MGKIPRKKIRLRRGLAAFALLAATSPVLFTAGSSAAPVGQGFTVTPSDLSHILRQVKIAERHVATTTPAFLAGPDAIPGNADDRGICDTLVGTAPNQIASPLVADGLRTVDGSCNNLIKGQEKFGAEGQIFPRLTSPIFKPAEGRPSGFFGPGDPGSPSSSYAQKKGSVYDTQPRLISNLIVDQTSTNPAAIAAAGFPFRTQGNLGVNPCVAVNEVQTISGTPSAPFSLVYDGQQTASLQPSATALEVRSALVALSNIGPADVAVSGGPLPGAITIKFQGALAATDVSQITFTAGTSPISGVTVATTTNGAPAVPAVPPVDEVQTVSGTPTADFTLSLGVGTTTGTILTTATAADVQTALEALPSIGAPNVAVTDGPAPATWTITFQGALAGINVDSITTDSADLTIATTTDGKAGVPAVPAVNEVQDISGTPNADFSIQFGSETTVTLAPNASSAAVQAALGALPGIGVGNVSVADGTAPITWTITFQGALAGIDVAEVTIVAGTSAITGLTLATPTAGSGGVVNCVPAHKTLFIPNVTTDVGLSPPFNSLFTIFGQFFDHGVDKIGRAHV